MNQRAALATSAVVGLMLLLMEGSQWPPYTPTVSPPNGLPPTGVAESDLLDGTSFVPDSRTLVWKRGATCSESGTIEPWSLGASVTMLAAGPYHGLALTGDGAVWGWGTDRFGQLGQHHRPDGQAPAAIPDLPPIVSIAVGHRHSLALDTDGRVWAWGDNTWGQVGDGTTDLRREPVAVVGLAGIRAVAAGAYHSLALDADGAVWAWGHGPAGALGDDRRVSSATPVRVAELSRVTAISAAGFHSLALQEDHTVWQWGSTVDGSDAADFAIPRRVSLPGSSEVVALAAGGAHTLVLRGDGAVWGWGSNSQGQLGDPAFSGRVSTPIQIPDLPRVVAVAAGELHSAVLTEDGTVWSWGVDHSCRGAPRAVPRPPTQLSGLPSIAMLTAGGPHTLAVERRPIRRLPPPTFGE